MKIETHELTGDAVKINQLSGAALDWVVAHIEGFTPQRTCMYGRTTMWRGKLMYRPSSDWAAGGPIIEREKIAVDCDGTRWVASNNTKPVCYSADTPLIAAMRCFAASKLGDEVEVPEELLK